MKRLSCIKSILAVLFVLAMLCSSAAADTVVYDLDDFTIEIDERKPTLAMDVSQVQVQN